MPSKNKREPQPLKMDEPGTYYVGGKHIVVPEERSVDDLLKRARREGADTEARTKKLKKWLRRNKDK